MVAPSNPKNLIAYISGINKKNGSEFESVFFEEHPHPTLIENLYIYALWGRRNPMTNQDFDSLPELYCISLYEGENSEDTIFHIRWIINKDDEVSEEIFTGTELNLINKSKDSELMRMICEV